MTKLVKGTGVILILLMCLTIISPVWAFELIPEPVRESYQNGEVIPAPTDIYTDNGEFNELSTDMDQIIKLEGDRNSVDITLQENSTGVEVTTVLEEVYGDDKSSLNIPVEPIIEPVIEPPAVPPNLFGTTTVDAPAHSIRLLNVKDNVAIGEQLQLEAQVLAETSGDICNDTVTWSSNNPDIATISSYGLLVGIADGLVEITAAATSDSNVAKSFTIGIGDETAPLQVIELFPHEYSTNVRPDTDIYIRYNKPVEANPLKANQQYGQIKYLTQNRSDYDKYTPQNYNANYMKESLLSYNFNGDPCAVGIAIGQTKNNLLEINTYYDIFFRHNSVRAIDSEEIREDGFGFTGKDTPKWRFNTVPNKPFPQGIEISNYPERLAVGDKFALEAWVIDNKGNYMDNYPVIWTVESIKNGDAQVDEKGVMTGIKAGTLKLTARTDGYPFTVSKNLEIRENFSSYLMGVWTTELTERISHNNRAPLSVGADGTIYLPVGAGLTSVIKAYDGMTGKLKENFQEITGYAWSPVLAEIEGSEYLLCSRNKKICAFDAHTGRLAWEVATGVDLVKPTVDAGGRIYVGSIEDGKVYAFDLNTDRYLWDYYVQFRSTALLYDLITCAPNGLIYVVGGNYNVFCLNSQGELQWKYETPTHRSISAKVELDSDGNIYFIENNDKIYSLNADGNLRWQFTPANSRLSNLFVDQDDSLYVNIYDNSTKIEKLTKINKENGTVEQSFDFYDCDRFMRNGDGYIYTNKFVFNDNLRVVGAVDLKAVGYTDDYYRNLPFMYYSPLALCPDGTLARYIIANGNVIVIEKVALMDTVGAIPHEIEIEEEITLTVGGTRDIFAKVKDSQGRLIPYAALDYQVDNSGVATVNEVGRINALTPGETTITVSVRDHSNVSAVINLQVLSLGEVNAIYFVPQHATPKEINLEERITSITGVVGEEKVVQLVVLDQRGQVIKDLPVKWTLDDSSVVQMYNYTGGVMGTVTKGTAVLNGLKEGTAILTAELEGLDGLSDELKKAQLTINIGAAPYEILWTMPIDGPWDHKIAHHTQADDGTLFIANQKKLKAVNNNGLLLWEQDIADQFGFWPATPVVDGKNVYVYDNSNVQIFLVALSQGDSSRRWTFNGGLGYVTSLQVGTGSVYLLTDAGKLYSLEADSGRSRWEAPLSLGNGDITLGLSSAGELYYALGHNVYRVTQEGKIDSLYAAEDGAKLNIKEVAPGGNIILEKKNGVDYSIISITAAGKRTWEVPVETTVELSSDDKGTIYVVTKTKDGIDPHVYFIRADGELLVDRVIKASKVVTPYNYEIYYKPLISTAGIVYLPLPRLYALNATDGALLWQGEFKDGFFKRVPKTATLDKNNVVYLACDDAGFIALRSKTGGVADESGFYIDTAGTVSLQGNTYRNLVFNVENSNENPMEIRVVTALEDSGNKVLNYTAVADCLAAGEKKTYNYGVYIPAAGGHHVSIKLLNQASQLITEKILSVGGERGSI